MQPFKSGMIVEKADFCGRAQEIRQLSSHMESKNRCYLYGERRVGKTSLVFETARLLKTGCITVDLLGVKSEDDLCRRLIKSILFFHQSKPPQLMDLLKQFAGLRPQLGLDPLTNLPTIGLSPSVALTINDLETAFEVLKKHENTVVFFDEFQDVLELPNADTVLAIMRSKIQALTHVAFVYAGSLRNSMLDIFTVDSSPFFKSAFPLNVSAIDEDVFLKFIAGKFKKNRRKIDSAVLHRIYGVCNGVPGDIQSLCASLWDISNDGNEINEALLPEALKHIFALEVPIYERILHSISSQQMKTLLALAELGGESSVSNEFIQHTGISLSGSVHKAMKGLAAKRIVCKLDGSYKFSNPFFKCWLLYKNI